MCVCFFADTLGTNNPKISRHLAYLKRAGLVTGRRDGKWMHYRIVKPTNEGAAKIFDQLLTTLAKERYMLKDLENLIRVCCVPTAPVQIKGRASASTE